MSAPPPQYPGIAPQAPPPQPSTAPAAAELDLEGLGKPKGVPVPVTIGGAVGGLAIGAVLGGLLLSGGGDAEAAASASVSAPPPPASSGPPPPPPKSLAERAAEGDAGAVKELTGKPLTERTGEETLALFRADLAEKRKVMEELARKTELVPAFGKSDETQGKIMAAVKDPRQSTMVLEVLAGIKGPIGPDYLYKVYKMRGRHEVTEQLALDLLNSKDVREKASDALKIALDLEKAVQEEQKDCPGMIKLLVRAQADADTRVFSPIAKLNSKRGCGKTKLEDCWPCLRDDEGKKALRDAVQLARKNKAPL